MFLKTNHPEALKALTDFNSQKSQLHASANAFAAEFNATPIVTGGANSVQFNGIVFKNRDEINFSVWTKPSPSNYRMSHLRVRPLKKEFQAEWDADQEKHKTLSAKHFPNGTRVEKGPIYTALGFDWGSLFFSKFGCFVYDGFIYIDTDIKGVIGDEILGSEYDEAHRKFKEWSNASE